MKKKTKKVGSDRSREDGVSELQGKGQSREIRGVRNLA